MKKPQYLLMLLILTLTLAGPAKGEDDILTQLSGVWQMDAERNRPMWDEAARTAPTEKVREEIIRTYAKPCFMILDLPNGRGFDLHALNYQAPQDTPWAITITQVQGQSITLHNVRRAGRTLRVEQDMLFVLTGENEMYGKILGFKVFNEQGTETASSGENETDKDIFYARRVSPDPAAWRSFIKCYEE